MQEAPCTLSAVVRCYVLFRICTVTMLWCPCSLLWRQKLWLLCRVLCVFQVARTLAGLRMSWIMATVLRPSHGAHSTTAACAVLPAAKHAKTRLS